MTTVTKIEHISSSDIDNECPYCKFDDAHKKPCNDCGEIHTPSPESFGKWLQRYFANSGTKEHENEVKMYTAHSRGGEHKDQIHNLRNSLESGKPKKLRSWGKRRPKKALKAECSGVGCKAEGKIPLTVSLDTGDVGKIKVCPECHKKILEHDATRRHMEANDPHRLSESQRDEMKAVMAVSAPEEGKTCNCNHGDHSNANGDLHSMYNQEGGRANWQGQGLPQPKHSNCQCDEQPVEHDKVPNADARLGEPKKDKKKKNDDYNPNREVVGAKDEDDFKRRQQGLGGKGGCRGVGCDKKAKHKIIALVRDHLTGSEVTNPNLSTRSHKEIINLCPDCYKKAKEWQKKRKNKKKGRTARNRKRRERKEAKITEGILGLKAMLEKTFEDITKKRSKRGGKKTSRRRTGGWGWFDKLQTDAKRNLKPKDTDDMTEDEALDHAHYTGGNIISNTPKPKVQRFGNLSDEVLEGLNINPKTGKSKKGGKKKKKKKIVQPKPVLTDDDPYKEAALIKALNILKRSPPRDAGYTARKKLADEMKRADENMKINEEKKKKKKKVKPKPKKSKFDFFNRTEGDAEAKPEMSAQEWLDDYKKKKKKRQLRYQTSKGDDDSNLPKPQTLPAKIENQDCPYCNTKRALERAGKKTDVRSFAELFNSINAKQAEEQRGGGLSLVNILNNYKLHEGGKEKLFHQAPSKKKKKVRIIKAGEKCANPPCTNEGTVEVAYGSMDHRTGKKNVRGKLVLCEDCAEGIARHMKELGGKSYSIPKYTDEELKSKGIIKGKKTDHSLKLTEEEKKQKELSGMFNYNYLFGKPNIEEGVTHGKKKPKKITKKKQIQKAFSPFSYNPQVIPTHTIYPTDKILADLKSKKKKKKKKVDIDTKSPRQRLAEKDPEWGADLAENIPDRRSFADILAAKKKKPKTKKQLRDEADAKRAKEESAFYIAGGAREKDIENQSKKSWVGYFLKAESDDWDKNDKKRTEINEGIKEDTNEGGTAAGIDEHNLVDSLTRMLGRRSGKGNLDATQRAIHAALSGKVGKLPDGSTVSMEGTAPFKKKKPNRLGKAEENQFGAWGQRGLGDGSGTGAIQGSGDTHLISPTKQKELDKLMAGARYLPRSVARKKP